MNRNIFLQKVELKIILYHSIAFNDALIHYGYLSMSCRVGDLSLSINWFVCEFFSVGEFLSPSCYSVSCLSVSCRVTTIPYLFKI